MIELVRYQDVLWAVSVRVGGEEALFLLDTAAGLTTLDRAFAERLGVATQGRYSGKRMSGEVVTLDLAQDVEVALGGRPIRHETVGVFDLMALLPSGWPPVGGALGLPTFEHLVVTLDFATRSLALDAQPGSGSRELHVRSARDGPALDLFIEVCASPTRSLWFELDTANTGPAILSPAAVEALGLEGVPEEVTLDVCGLGEVRTPVAVAPIRYDGNLGASFFASRALTLDLAAERAWVPGD